MRILLIDDDQLVRTTLKSALERLGVDVDARADGQSGVSSIAAGVHYDAVVTDIYMPGMDGIEFIRLMRELNSALPVIAMTGGSRTRLDGRSELEILRMAGSLGAVLTIQKPFRSSDLLAAFGSILPKPSL